MSGVNEIRSAFLDYFARHGHEVVPSSPLVPRNDPTLMFTNAGMVQFKNVFTGVEKRPYSRAATSQKCVRAGGKHNDLDNVGYTARHHTFFEQGDQLWGGPPGSPEEDGDRFLEFWNLVFMQYEQIEPGNRIGLPKPSIDTGMGLERMAAILQGVHSNYDTDLFRTLIDAVVSATGASYDGNASH